MPEGMKNCVICLKGFNLLILQSIGKYVYGTECVKSYKDIFEETCIKIEILPQTAGGMDRIKGRLTDRQTELLADLHTDRITGRWTELQADGQTYRKT